MASNIPRPAAVTGPGPPVQSPSPAPALAAPSPSPAPPAQPPRMAPYNSLPPAHADASAPPLSMASYHVGPHSNAGNPAQQPHTVSYNPYPPTGPGVMMHPPPAPRPSHRSIPSAGMTLAQQQQHQQQQQQQQQAMAAYHQRLQAGRRSATPVPSMAAINQLSNYHQRADPAARMRATSSPFNLPPAMMQPAPARSQQQPPAAQQYQPPAYHPPPSPAPPQQIPSAHQQQTQQLQLQQTPPTHQQQPQQLHRQPLPPAAHPLPQPPLIEPHPLSPSLAALKLIAHPLSPTLLPHLSLTTTSSLARLFLDFEYRDLSTTDYALFVPPVPPAQRAWLAAHLRALNAARRASGALLVAHWQRLVRERTARSGDWVADTEDVPGGGEAELRRLDWVAREVYGRCADGTRLPVLVWEYVQLRQVRGPSAKEWEDFVVDAVGEVWRMRERARRGVERGEEGEEGEEEEEGNGGPVVWVGGGVVGEAELRAAMRERQRGQRSGEGGEVPSAGVSKMRSPPRSAGAVGRQRSSTASKPKPAKLAQSKTPGKRGGKKGSRGQIMFQAPPAGSSGSAVNPIAVDADLPDYPDDYGTGNMATVPDKYSFAANTSPAFDRTVTAQDTASQFPHYPELHEIKPAKQLPSSQNTTSFNTTTGLSNTGPAPATQRPDYPPIFSTDAEPIQAGPQHINTAPTNPSTPTSTPAQTTPLPSSSPGPTTPSSAQPPITIAATTPPSTPHNTAAQLPAPPSSAAASAPAQPQPQPLPLPATQPGQADTSSAPATDAPQGENVAVPQLDGAFDMSEKALDALFEDILNGS